jgi:hypothetical protein
MFTSQAPSFVSMPGLALADTASHSRQTAGSCTQGQSRAPPRGHCSGALSHLNELALGIARG